MVGPVTFDFSELERFAVEIQLTEQMIYDRMTTVVRKSAFDIEKSAKEIVPVDTGYLKSTITSEFRGSRGEGWFMAEIGPTASYGIYVELGTSRMRPQPYLGPATEKHAPAFYRAAEILGQQVRLR